MEKQVVESQKNNDIEEPEAYITFIDQITINDTEKQVLEPEKNNIKSKLQYEDKEVIDQVIGINEDEYAGKDYYTKFNILIEKAYKKQRIECLIMRMYQ